VSNLSFLGFRAAVVIAQPVREGMALTMP